MYIPQVKNRSRHTKRGFALIATISVMVLLVMIALAMLSLSTIEVRASRNASAMTEAKANARLALMLAIGHLQRTAGADDRATAPSLTGSYADGKDHWTAVYRVREEGKVKSVMDRHESEDYITDQRSSAADFVQNKLFIDWLVSQSGEDVANVDEYAELVGSGSSTRSRAVVAPLIKTDGGAYAYWVGDESLKARVDHQLPDPMPKENSPEYQALLSSSPKSDIKTLTDGTNELFPNYDTASPGVWPKMLTYNENQLAGLSGGPKEARDALRSSYFSLTNYSEGLLTNPLDGGFKKDLSAFMGQPMNIKTIAESETGRADGISGATSMIPGKRHLKTGPKFDALRRYNLIRHVVKKGSSTGAQASIKPMDRLPGDTGFSMSVSQRDLGQYQRVELGGTAADLTAVDRPNIHPVLAEATCAFDYSYYNVPGATDPARKYGIRAHLYPSVKLWNPYNVSLKIPDYVFLIRCLGDSRLASGNKLAQTLDFKAGVPADDQKAEHKAAFRNHMGSHDAGAKGNPEDAAQIRRYFGFTIKSVTIDPGETVVFSPDWRSGTSTLTSPGARGAAKYSFDFSDNPMSASAYPGEGSFYLNFPNVYGTPNSTYGFAGNHMWIPDTGAGEQAMIKAIPSGSTGVLDYQTVAVNSGSAKNFPTVAYVNTNPAGLFYDMGTQGHASYLGLKTMTGGTGGTALAHLAANGVGNKRLRNFSEVDIGPPPRFWRYGSRLNYYDELGGIMDGFSAFYGDGVGVALTDSWNPRAPFNHTSWITQNASWTKWTTGTHVQSPIYPLNNGADGADAPFGPVNGKYLANPWSSGEGRGSEPSPDQRIVLFDLPRPDVPLMSLADFRHAQLTYSPWHPTYIVGRGKADGRSDPDATIIRASNAYTTLGVSSFSPEDSQRWTKNPIAESIQRRNNKTTSWGWLNQDNSVIGKVKASPDDPGRFSSTSATHDDEILVYDIAYEVNHALWDRFFLSSIPYTSSGKPVWNEDTPLANNRLHLDSTAFDASQQFEDGLYGSKPEFFAYHQSGRYLVNRGAFNVNSTSVDAWKVMLNSLRGMNRQAAVDGKSSAGYGGAAFSGLLFPGISEGQKAGSNTDSQVLAGYRELEDAEIEDLAEAIVEQVKLRGPFLTLGDFVNRRLVSVDSGVRPKLTDTAGTALMSPLEAAIELSGINSVLHTGDETSAAKNTADDRVGPLFNHWMDKRMMTPWKTAGLPGHLDQGALLSSLGSAITTRGDTFVIRAYGEARSGANNETVLARAWCEAVVQRSLDYVNPEDDAMEPLTVAASGGTATTQRVFNTKLSEQSRRYGRRYVVKQFRWLQKNEI